MTCFVCGQHLSPAARIAVTGHTTNVRDKPILIHDSCASVLAEQVLASMHAAHERAATPAPATPSDRLGLSPGELRILRRVALGETNRCIARRLGLTEKTIKNRMSVILAKLDVTSRTQAAILGAQMGLLQDEKVRDPAGPEREHAMDHVGS